MTTHEAELREVVLARSRALVKGEIEHLKRVLADEFSYTNSDGMVLSRADYIENYVESSAFNWLEQELSDLRLQVYGDTGVASFQVHDRAEYEGEPFDGIFRSLFVYVRKDGRWQCVAAQTVRVQGAA